MDHTDREYRALSVDIKESGILLAHNLWWINAKPISPHSVAKLSGLFASFSLGKIYLSFRHRNGSLIPTHNFLNIINICLRFYRKLTLRFPLALFYLEVHSIYLKSLVLNTFIDKASQVFFILFAAKFPLSRKAIVPIRSNHYPKLRYIYSKNTKTTRNKSKSP